MPTRSDRPVIERRPSIREQVQNYLTKSILEGRIAPGARLVETQVAQELGVSRTPVREALQILESEGLLEGSSGIGYCVRAISRNEVAELCEIRVANETLAALWAMERITPEELRALEESLDRAEAEIRGGSSESLAERIWDFHEILAAASGSEHLYEVCRMLQRHMLRYRLKALYDADSGFLAVAGHRRILEALRSKDGEALQRAIRDHIEQSKEDIGRKAFNTEKTA